MIALHAELYEREAVLLLALTEGTLEHAVGLRRPKPRKPASNTQDDMANMRTSGRVECGTLDRRRLAFMAR